MGCDIHFHVEKRTADGWERAEAQVKNRWFGEDPAEAEFAWESFFDGRNYALFAMLANVRNGFGFAGVDTGDPVVPIDEPRGLPEDASADVRQSSDDWDADGHSHSWFTLRELLAVDWHGNTVTHRGWVDPENYDRWRKTGKPESWCGGVSGRYTEHVSNEGMARLIEGLKVRTRWNAREYDAANGDRKNPTSYYTNVQWSEPWQQAAREFTSTLVRMARVAAVGNLSLDDVRAVFWFDN